MIKRELLKPRKVIWVMRDFINEIHGLTYTDCIIPAMVSENETIEEFMERLHNAEEIEVPSQVKMTYRKKVSLFARLKKMTLSSIFSTISTNFTAKAPSSLHKTFLLVVLWAEVLLP